MNLSPKLAASTAHHETLSPQRFSTLRRTQGAEWVAALAGAAFIGTLVGIVNYPHGLSSALLAGGKQALWTALIAGLLTRFCRYLCSQTSMRLLPPMVGAVVLPSVLAVVGVSVLHHLEGTANPWGSVLITVILAPPGFCLIAHKIRRANRAAQQANNVIANAELRNNPLEV